MSDILVDVDGHVGRIVLNRPQAINALSSAMIDDLTRVLREWEQDPDVHEVVIAGAGRGFCAGADVREMRRAILDGSADPVDFLAREYGLDRLIATYPKPYTARLHGIVMGGGMGVSIHGSTRLVAPNVVMAMPETIIGLWPDVGVCHALSRLPGEIGTYMALTGQTITAAQAVRVGLAQAMVASDAADAPVVDLDAADGGSPAWLDLLAGDDIVAILGRLEASEDADARETARVIRLRSPFSVVVTLRALRRAARMTLDEVFEQDICLGRFFAQWPDFVEGVRAQLVDKDFSPRWAHARVEDVTDEEASAAFGETAPSR
ncbi:MAG: enoyl-CoA hydratase/isomerase family protein [Propionibacteriaceae bacterium]|nr:enoyl-CoA hydratase/isomerase family protein [Propionibacteriaceae bacterium]